MEGKEERREGKERGKGEMEGREGRERGKGERVGRVRLHVILHMYIQ